jgi:hypothetical protein
VTARTCLDLRRLAPVVGIGIAMLAFFEYWFSKRAYEARSTDPNALPPLPPVQRAISPYQ